MFGLDSAHSIDFLEHFLSCMNGEIKGESTAFLWGLWSVGDRLVKGTSGQRVGTGRMETDGTTCAGPLTDSDVEGSK